MKKFIITFTFVMMLLLIACNGKNGASLLGDTSNNGNNSSNAGYGVTGWLDVSVQIPFVSRSAARIFPMEPSSWVLFFIISPFCSNSF